MTGHQVRVINDPKTEINNLKLVLAEDQNCLENLKHNVHNYRPYILKKKTDKCLLRIRDHKEKLRELKAITKPTSEAVPMTNAEQAHPVNRQSASGNPFDGNPHSNNYQNNNRQVVGHPRQVLGNPLNGNPSNSNPHKSDSLSGNPLNGGTQKADDHQYTNGTRHNAAIPKKKESLVPPFQENSEVIAKTVRTLVQMGLREEEYIRRSKERWP